MKFNGKKLKQLRLSKGYKQSDIAQLTKEEGLLVDSRTLSHWENAENANPRPQNVAIVAKVLGVRPDELYVYKNEPLEVDNPARQDEQFFNSQNINISFIRLLESQGYIYTITNNEIILHSSGRANDLRLSIDDINSLTTKTADYIEYLLFCIRNNK